MFEYSYTICAGDARNIIFRADWGLYKSLQHLKAEAMRRAIYLFGPLGWHHIDYWKEAQFTPAGSDNISREFGYEWFDRDYNLNYW